MTCRRAYLFLAALGLAAYFANTTALARCLVVCQEVHGRTAVEPAADRGCCEAGPQAGSHAAEHEGAAGCAPCSSCPCQDSPLEVDLATSPQRDAAPVPPAVSAWTAPPRLLRAAAPDPLGIDRSRHAAVNRQRMRCLRSVVLLV